MSDSQEAAPNETGCPFCGNEFGREAKLILDCCMLICVTCYEWRVEDAESGSREFQCLACGEHHVLPESGFPSVRQLPRKVQKPVPPQAKQLEPQIKRVQAELEALLGFDWREHVEQTCERLEFEVREAAHSAVKHIGELERTLLKQIDEYRQRCLDARSSPCQMAAETKSEVNDLATQFQEFSRKWMDYFRQLSAYARESEIEAAVLESQQFGDQIKQLEQKLRTSALNGSMLQFSGHSEFFSKADLLGQLAEISTCGTRSESRTGEFSLVWEK